MIRVAVVDDHPIVSEGFGASLQRAPDIAVAWVAGSLAEARSRLATAVEDTDVVLVDVRLTDGLGFELLPDPRAERPAFVVMSSYDRSVYAVRAFQGGALGFVLKTAPIEEILEAVRRATAGLLTYAASHLEAIRTGPVLTPRELEVVRLVGEARSNDEIAARLGISPKTVEAYLREVFRRLGIASRTELAVRAEREGWLDEA